MKDILKDILKALRLGLICTLIIGFSLTLLYILIAMLINGGGVYVVETNRPVLISEILLMACTLCYGCYLLRVLIRKQ